MSDEGRRMVKEAGQVVVVVPTIRESHIQAFLRVWNFGDWVKVLVIEDQPEPTFELGSHPNVTHYSHADIERDLGEDAWIIPRRTDCVRSYGYWKAWQLKPDMIVTLDDDCYPYPVFFPDDLQAHDVDGLGFSPRAFLFDHWRRLEGGGSDNAWENTLEGISPRGIPYHNKTRQWKCLLNHGLWNGVLDMDAVTQLGVHRNAMGTGNYLKSLTIPRGSFFPMCGMNLAFRPEAVPALYFLLMGPAYPFDRFGDIWAGIIFKRICDHLGYAITSGEPTIEHMRASSVWANLVKEAPGMELNEKVWEVVDNACLRSSDMIACYRQIADALGGLGGLKGDYWRKLREAMYVWSSLFE